jgi:hypothetical protein
MTSLERPRRRMPLFLKVVMVGAAVMGSLGALMTTLGLVAIAFVPGPYMVNGRRASPEEFVGFAIPALGSYFALSALAVTVAWGLRHGRPWVRPLMLGLGSGLLCVPMVLAFVSGLDLSQALPSLLVCAAMLVVLWWQLYFDDDIIAYYAALRDDARG